MLLGMLITILTMVFNSSSIAWSTGKAGVAEMDTVRNNMAAASIVADNAVPRVDVNTPSTWGVLVSPWDKNGNLRKRAVMKVADNTVANQAWGGLGMDSKIKNPNKESGKGSWVRNTGIPLWATFSPGSVNISGNAKGYIVGVWSVGPDGKENTGDDISTWPDLD
jgi:hypothetical protein